MGTTTLVLASTLLGLIAGGLIAWALFAIRDAHRRQQEALRPALPEAAIEVLHALDDFAVILDASLSVVYANPAARDGQHPTGERLRDAEFLRSARQVMQTGTPHVIEPETDDLQNAARVRIVRLQRKFLVVFSEDLGEEQRVNAMRRDFIANVSHELKTPIAAMGLLSEAILEAADEPQHVRNFAQKLTKESVRLADLSRDIIQLSEAQTSLRAEELEPVSLRSLLRTEVEAHREYATQRGVELVITDLDTQATSDDPTTMGRPGALGIAIANLLSNAIRHSPEGGRVGIGMSVRELDCVVAVADQGEGIAAEHLPRIFERFYRVDAARSRAAGGTGLGLSITRHTMRAHGGDIQVWSQPGVGSTFTLTFPIAANGKAPKKRKKRAGARNREEVAR